MKTKTIKSSPKTVNLKSNKHISSDKKAILTFLNAVSDSAFLIDPKGVMLWTGNAASEMIPNKKNNLPGQDISDFLSIDISEFSRKYLDEILKTKKNISFEDFKNGKWSEYFLHPVFNGKSEVIMIAVYGKDITGRKETEEAEKSSESFLNSLIDQSPYPMWISDDRGTLIRINRSCLDLLHITEEEVVGKYNILKDNIVKEQGYANLIRRVFEAGETAKFEIKYNTTMLRGIHVKHKASLVLESTVFPIKDSTGRITNAVIQHMDVTDRKLAEEKLQKANETLRAVIEAAPLAIFDLDEEGHIQNIWNPAAERMLGWSRDEVLGHFLPTVQDDTKEEFKSFRDHIRAGKTIIGKDIRRRRKDGSPIDYSLYAAPVFDSQNNVIGNLAILMDITERKRNEESLFSINETLRALVNSSPLSIIALDPEGIVKLWNPAAHKIFGWSEEEVLGRTMPLVPKDKVEEYNALRRRVMEGEAFTEINVRRRRKDGALIDISLSTAPLRNLQGKVIGIMSVSADITEQKKIEASLRESENRFRALFTVATEGISLHRLVFDGNNNIINYMMLDVNPQYETILNLKREEVINKLATEIYGTAEAPYLEEYASVVKSGNPCHFETYFPPMNKYFYISVSSMGSDLFATIFFDITERKLAEEKLRQVNETLRAIVEASPLAIFDLDEEGRILSIWNPAAERMLGWTRDEVIGRFLPSVQDDAKEEFKTFREEVHAGKTLMGKEVRRRRKDGSIIYYSIYSAPIFDAHKKVAGNMAILMDITERKRAEESLHASEERYRHLVESVTDYIYTVKIKADKSQTTFHGPGCLGVTGYDSSEFAADPYLWFRMIHPDDRQAVTRLMEKMHSGSDALPTEHRIIHKNGTVRWVKNTVVPKRDDKGNLTAYDGLITDITQLKLSEEAKERLHSQLRQAQKMEAIGTFVGGIAHDFNNILSVLMGYANLLHMELDNDNPFYTYVEQILSSSEKAANLTKSLLSFSRKQPITRVALNLNNIIRNTETLLKRLITEDIALEVKYNEDNIIIMGDPSQVDQILFNLMTNARDAMPKGGKIMISTNFIELDADFISLLGYGKPGKYALISVSDNGTGMDEKTREQIFDPFFTTKEVGKGTGLGLSTVYGIVKQHEGYISVYSEPGSGTAFHIYFPAVTGIVPEEKPNYFNKKHGKETILVAEDNESVRLLIKTVLAKFGYSVIEAVDGEDAIDKFKKFEKVDLVIIDSVMPKKNGRQVYDNIIKINPAVKVLFSSGYTRDVILDKGIEEKEVDFISKPLTPDELLQKVRCILDKR